MTVQVVRAEDNEQLVASSKDAEQLEVSGEPEQRQPSASPCAACSGSGKRGVFGPAGLGMLGFDCRVCGGTGQGMEGLRLSWRAKLCENGWALEKAPSAVQQDRGLVLAAVQSQGLALEYGDPVLKSDPGIVRAAVQQDARALAHASEELKADRSLMLSAVSCFGTALRFSTSKAVLSDREVVLKAIENDPDAFIYADWSLRSDREFVLGVVQQWPLALPYASNALREDRDVALAAVTSNGRALQFVRTHLRGDRAVVLQAVAHEGTALRHALKELQADPQIVRVAIAQNPAAAKYARLADASTDASAPRPDAAVPTPAETEDCSPK